MDIVYRCCCGLDVHKDRITVNLLRRGVEGKKNLDEIRSFGTMTHELLELSDWLKEADCTHVAMESTGVYWKPVFNILEADFEVILVNARHIKNVPGRKTDIKDCQWIAQLLQHGLLSGSFIPPKPIRELRDLTRQRRKLINERSSVVQRIQKVLEDANIKLASVATDIMGKSGWDILTAIVRGENDPNQLTSLARGRLRSKKEQLLASLAGNITDHHRFLLKQHLKQITFLNTLIEEFDDRIEKQIRPFFEYIPLLDTIPGVNKKTAEELIAELGVNMVQFPDDKHLYSWAGMCPGNNESAGKHKSGKTTKGSKWLKSALTEAAWAAGRTKGTYMRSHYRRLASRRGKKRALVAVGHTILVIVYHVMKNYKPYYELGEDFFERLNVDRLRYYYSKRLEALGYKVELTKSVAA